MKSKSTLLPLLVLFIASSLPAQDAPSPAAEASTNLLTLKAVIGEVLSNNPSLKSARASWEAMRERVPQARAWEDSRMSFDTLLGRFVDQAPDAMTDQRVMAEQTLPLSGKNRLRGQAAEAEAVGSFEEFRRRQLDAVTSARTAYFELADAQVQLEINRKNTALLRQVADVSRARYETGSRSQADVLGAETELARLAEAAYDIQRGISEAQTRLNTLMNRPPQTPLGRPAAQVFQPVNIDALKVEGLALTNRPELRVADSRLDAARSRLAAAHKEWIPEPSLRLGADRYNDSSRAIGEVNAGFSISLPWFNRGKYKAAIRENEKLVEAAGHDRDSLRLETLGLLRDQLKRVETFYHHTELFETKLLPLAEQSVTSRRLSFETDKASLLELLTAQQAAREVESMYWDHLMHYQIALAELESLVGASLDPALSPATAHQHEPK